MAIVRKILSFLQPSFAKVSLFLIIWIIFYLVFILIFKNCITGDCRNFQNELISCCSQTTTALAYFFYNYRVLFLILTYLFSCLLLVNLENAGTISHQAKRL